MGMLNNESYLMAVYLLNERKDLESENPKTIFFVSQEILTKLCPETLTRTLLLRAD